MRRYRHSCGFFPDDLAVKSGDLTIRCDHGIDTGRVRLVSGVDEQIAQGRTGQRIANAVAE